MILYYNFPLWCNSDFKLLSSKPKALTKEIQMNDILRCNIMETTNSILYINLNFIFYMHFCYKFVFINFD